MKGTPMHRFARTLLGAAFAAIFAASCSLNLDAPGAVDADKAAMYVHVKLADAVLAAEAAARGHDEGFDDLARAHRELQAASVRLREGSGARLASELVPSLHAMEQILREREKVLDAIDTGRSAIIRTPQMSAQMSEVVRGMADTGAQTPQVIIANRQIVLLDRMARRIVEVIEGGDGAITAADALQRDQVVLGQVLEGLASGAPEAGIERVESPAARAAIDKLVELNQDQAGDVKAFLGATTTLAEVHQAADALSRNRVRLLELAPPEL
jgi:twitching motility protein PilJ